MLHCPRSPRLNMPISRPQPTAICADFSSRAQTQTRPPNSAPAHASQAIRLCASAIILCAIRANAQMAARLCGTLRQNPQPQGTQPCQTKNPPSTPKTSPPLKPCSASTSAPPSASRCARSSRAAASNIKGIRDAELDNSVPLALNFNVNASDPAPAALPRSYAMSAGPPCHPPSRSRRRRLHACHAARRAHPQSPGHIA